MLRFLDIARVKKGFYEGWQCRVIKYLKNKKKYEISIKGIRTLIPENDIEYISGVQEQYKKILKGSEKINE